MTGLAGPDVATRRRRLVRRVVPIVAAIAIVGAAIAAGPPGEGRRYDPTSTQRGGLRGVVDIVETLGRQIDISTDLPDDETTRYLLLHDDLTVDQRDAVRAWVAEGGVLVLTDPASALSDLAVLGGLATDRIGATTFTAGCDLLDGIGPVRSSAWQRLEVPDDAEACFRVDADGAWLVHRAQGAGAVLTLGGADPLLNEHLVVPGNGRLAVALLAPGSDDRVLVRPLPEPGSGDAGLLDVLPRRVRHLLLAFPLAFLILVWWRSRRLGQPVPEPLPLRVPGAALVDGVGALLQRSGDRDGVVAVVRSHVRRRLGQRLAVPADTSDELLARLAAERLGMDPDEVALILSRPVRGDDDLLDLARRAAEIDARLRGAAAWEADGPAPTLPPRDHATDAPHRGDRT